MYTVPISIGVITAEPKLLLDHSARVEPKTQ